MLIADVAIIVLIIALGILGFLKGFKKSFISFFGFFVSVFVAVFFAKTVASALLSVDAIGGMVAGKNSLFSFIRIYLPEGLDTIKVSEIKSAYDTLGAAKVRDLFKGKGISSVFMDLCYPMIKSALTNPYYLNSTMATATDLVAMELAYGIFCLITGVVMFIVIRIIVASISIVFKKSRKDKKKSLTGRLIGFALGSVKGFLYTLVILSVFSFMTGLSFMQPISDQIADSSLAKPLTGLSMSITSNILQNNPDDLRYSELIRLGGFKK